MISKSFNLSVTDRLLAAIAFRLTVLVLMSLAPRMVPAPDAQAQGIVRIAGLDSRH